MRFGQKHFLRIISNWISLICFLSYLTKNTTYGVAKDISFYSNIMLRVEILENQDFDKYLPQLSKSLPSIRS